jgi:sugar lactone lactonase YvrE
MRTRAVLVSTLTALSVVVSGGLARASVAVETVVAFDPNAGEFPEGVAVGPTGTLYVSLIEPVGDVVKFEGGTRSVLAHFDAASFGPLGLATDAEGNVYVCVSTLDATTRGVYVVTPDGTSTRLPGTEGMLFPNGVALGRDGTVYATDSIGGSVWRVPPGGTGAVWLQDPLLAGTGEAGLGFPLGANGIGVRRDHVFVSNTEGARVVKIPVRDNENAGAPKVLAEGDELFGSDGLAMSAKGNAFVAVNTQNTLLRVARNGSMKTFATGADGLENPASLAFGTVAGDRTTLYITNFSIFTTPPHPALLSADVGEQGLPLP